jgi:DNA-binding Xre family transcriptional regulator
MANISRILDTLKDALKNNGKTYKDVGKALDISESSVKRLFSTKNITMERVEQMCELINLNIFDIIHLADSRKATITRKTTLEQENLLAADDDLFMIFYLLVSRWTVDDILYHYDFDIKTVEAHLLKLDKAKLLELHPNNKVKMLIRKSIKWIPDGPIESIYKSNITEEFLDYDFTNKPGNFEFRTWELSPATIDLLMRKLTSLAKEIEEMARLDENLPKEKIEGMGMLLAIRPWTLSKYSDYRLKKTSKK